MGKVVIICILRQAQEAQGMGSLSLSKGPAACCIYAWPMSRLWIKKRPCLNANDPGAGRRNGRFGACGGFLRWGWIEAKAWYLRGLSSFAWSDDLRRMRLLCPVPGKTCHCTLCKRVVVASVNLNLFRALFLSIFQTLSSKCLKKMRIFHFFLLFFQNFCNKSLFLAILYIEKFYFKEGLHAEWVA